MKARLLFLSLSVLLNGCSFRSLDMEADPRAEASGSVQVQSAVDLPADRKTLLMHYMPWYVTPEGRGNGRWGNHWAGHQRQHDPDTLGEDGLRDIFSHYYPLIGPYDSADPDVLTCQLLQMKLAGVDGVIADWYGIRDTYNYAEIHEATELLFRIAGELGMTFSVCYEDRTVQAMVKLGHLQEEDIGQHLEETMRWMEENWFGEEHYQRYQDRPLLLNFGPIYVREPAVWDAALAIPEPRPYFFALHHLWRKASGDGGFTWVHKHAWKDTDDPALIKERLTATYSGVAPTPEQVMVSATPGFHDIYPKGFDLLRHRDGKTLRESLEVCMEGPWDLVQLVTWNDYGEGTMLEPTHEFGYSFLEIIQEARRRELGENFPYSPEDLRLPARWLEALRSHPEQREALSSARNHLAEGRPREARRILEELSGP